MGKLKIGFVLDDTLDTPDGVQQYIVTLGRWLTRQGHDVHYLVGYTTRTDLANVHSLSRNLKVQFNGNRMSTPLPASRRRIKQLLNAEQFDILHVQIPYSPFLAQRIMMAAPATTTLVGTFHIAPHSASVVRANQLLGRLLRRSSRKFDTVFSVSRAAAEFAKSAYNLDTTILPNVVEAEHFKKALPIEPASTVPTIMFLGRLVPRKGCHILLEALAELITTSKVPFKAVICGKGPLRQQLETYAQEHGLAHIVQFVGFVDNDQKACYLKAADIAVFPSTGGESFGIVLIEAMAAEHPVVLGAANAGYATVLEPYPAALFTVNNPAALAAKLEYFLSNKIARQQAVDWQKSYVRQFDVDVVGRRLVSRYLEALRRKRSVR